MAHDSIPMICLACLHRWAEQLQAVSADPVVRCPRCGTSSTPLETAAAAWALGDLTRDEFFAIAGAISPDGITETLAALARITRWWEARTRRDDPGDSPPGQRPTAQGASGRDVDSRRPVGLDEPCDHVGVEL